jgi:hypothetical protein
MCIERAFERLKGTWKILSRVLWKPCKKKVSPMIYACCILHDLIIDTNDGLAAIVWQNYTPNPPGYSGVLHPTTQIF